jgi:hypothetical protein
MCNCRCRIVPVFGMSLLLAAFAGGCRTAPSESPGTPADQHGAGKPPIATIMPQGTADARPSDRSGTAPFGERLRVQRRWAALDGVVVEVLREGDGQPASLPDTIVAEVLGVFPDCADHDRAGRVFYSTVQSQQPLRSPIIGLIRGWQIGVPGMRVGEIRRLRVPWEVAYGVDGRPDESDPRGGIPPKADLIFTIELVEVLRDPTATPR